MNIHSLKKKIDLKDKLPNFKKRSKSKTNEQQETVKTQQLPISESENHNSGKESRGKGGKFKTLEEFQAQSHPPPLMLQVTVARLEGTLDRYNSLLNNTDKVISVSKEWNKERMREKLEKLQKKQEMKKNTKQC